MFASDSWILFLEWKYHLINGLGPSLEMSPKMEISLKTEISPNDLMDTIP